MIAEGHPAPDFTLESIDDKTVTLSLITPLWPVLVIFFRTRCDACRILMPQLKNFQRSYGDADVEILAVSQDGKITTREFIASFRWPGRVLVDHPLLEVSNAYKVECLPAAVLVGTDMIVRAAADASDLNRFERLAKKLASMVAWPYKPLLEPEIGFVEPCPSKSLQHAQ